MNTEPSDETVIKAMQWADDDQAPNEAIEILWSCGLAPSHHATLKEAAEGVKSIITTLRSHLADPPIDVQEAVLWKLGIAGRVPPEPNKDAVNAALKWAEDEEMNQDDERALLQDRFGDGDACATQILAAEVRRLRNEASIWQGRHHDALTAYSEERIARKKAENQAREHEIETGFLADLLDQIQALVDGHGVGLRDSVLEVLGKRSK